MDGKRKKRKMANEELEDQIDEENEELEDQIDEENEEKKMEKFFALIRSTKDVKQRLNLMSNEGKLKEDQEEKKKLGNENRPIGIWNPKFQVEDFVEEAEKMKIQIPFISNQAGPSTKNGSKEDGGDKGEGDDALDLNLSL